MRRERIKKDHFKKCGFPSNMNTKKEEIKRDEQSKISEIQSNVKSASKV